jgi:hypothetical protein
MKARSVDEHTERLKVLAWAKLGLAGDCEAAQKACARVVALLKPRRRVVVSITKRSPR